MKKQKVFTVVEVLLLLLVVAVVGFGAFFVYTKNTDESANSKTGSISDQNNNKINASTLITTTFVNSTGKSASVQHPKDWEVTTVMRDASPEDPLPATIIKSPLGHYLQLWEVSGIGGACGENHDSYSLTKKIATATPNVYFAEYISGSNIFNFGLEEYNSYKSTEHKSLQEGESSIDTCNISSYTSANEIYVTISDSSSFTIHRDLAYSELESDTEFIDMLRTLSLK